MLLEQFSEMTGLNMVRLEHFANTASARYKNYTIPKRNGGSRLIAQPSREIKAIQRWLVGTLFVEYPVHQSATAYKKGASIKDNALRHVRSSFTLHLDFSDFFPSFRNSHVERYLIENRTVRDEALSDADVSFITRIVCRDGALTIGAPSSPILTNFMMYEFDNLIAEWCRERSLIFSRYADDLFFSSSAPDALSDVLPMINRAIENYRFSNLRINAEKTTFLSRRYRRSITGIVITPEHKLSIGRERKMRLKSDIYEFSKGRLAKEHWSRVAGMLAFVRDVEPEFYGILLRKYGAFEIQKISEK